MYMGWQCNLGQDKYFGHGPCSVNIMKQLYTNDYYCAKITLDDSEFILDNTIENARTARVFIFPQFHLIEAKSCLL